MVDAKNLARELHRKFTKVARARQAEGQPSPITVQIPLPHNAPQVWSGSSLDPKGLVGELKMQWGESDNTAALRGALFAGSLDALMRLEKEAPKTETLVRYHDSAAGLDRLESMTDFLGLPNAQGVYVTRVTPGVVFLCSEEAPTGVIMTAGGGAFAISRLIETEGAFLGQNARVEDVRDNWAKIVDDAGQQPYFTGGEQSQKFFRKMQGG